MSQKLPNKWIVQPKCQLLLMLGLLMLLVVPFNLAFGADWVVAGNFQDDLPGAACGDWDNACAATTTEDADGDGVNRLIVDGLPAGTTLFRWIT